MDSQGRIRIRTAKELGVLARVVRKAQNLRGDDLSGVSKVSHSFVRDLEHGKETLQLGKALKVLDELGIRVSVSLPPNLILDEASPYPRGSTQEQREEIDKILEALLALERWPTA